MERIHLHNRVAARALRRLVNDLETLADCLEAWNPEKTAAADAAEQVIRHADHWIDTADVAIHEND